MAVTANQSRSDSFSDAHAHQRKWSRIRRYRNSWLAGAALLLGACTSVPNTVPEPPIAPGARFAVAQTGEPVELIGILAVLDQDNCRLDDGCGPKYRIFSEDFDDRIALLGEIADDHRDQIIRVRGTWTFMSDEDRKGVDREWGDTAVDVTGYEVLSPLKYRDFLVDKANRYTEENFGCSSLWDKSFRWRINNDQLSLIVRITKSQVDLGSLPYIELRYDAQTESLIDEIKSSVKVNPCESASGE